MRTTGRLAMGMVVAALPAAGSRHAVADASRGGLTELNAESLDLQARLTLGLGLEAIPS